jgi:hypothetical protein
VNEFRDMRGIADVTKTLASKSSLNPTLLLAAIVVPVSLVLGYLSEGQAQTFLFGLAAAVVTVALLQIVGFSIFDRNRLDDHKHTENKMIIAQMRPHFGDADGTQFLSEDEGVIIENPVLKKESDQ